MKQSINQLKKECCVGELWKKLGLPQNLVSHHLKVLKTTGLISSEKQGLKVIYRLNKVILDNNLKALKKFLSRFDY